LGRIETCPQLVLFWPEPPCGEHDAKKKAFDQFGMTESLKAPSAGIAVTKL